MPKPNFFIVGAQKCGTTAMYHYLDAHPDIFMPVVKEPHYFGTDNNSTRLTRFRGSIDNYLALFDDATTETAIGEASPSYLLSTTAARELYEFNPDARILIMLRSPVELVYSLYHHARYMGDEPMPTFREAITPELEHGFDHHTNRTYSYLDVARNSILVKRYLETFPREQIKIILMDDFKRDLPGVYRDTLAFLKVDADFQPDFAVVNASKDVRSKSLQRTLEKLHLTPSHVRDSRLFRAMTRLMPAPIYEFGIRQATKLYTREARYAPMDADLQGRLQVYFQSEIDTLGDMIDRDLTHWYADANQPIMRE